MHVSSSSSTGLARGEDHSWLAEDFSGPAPSRPSFVDFWSIGESATPPGAAPPLDRHTVPAEREMPLIALDWLWDLPVQQDMRSGRTVAFDQWSEGSIPGAFLPGAADNPFSITILPPRREELVTKRARWLVSLLDVPEPRRRRSYVRFFERVFDEFDHHNTYRALINLALDERLEAEALAEACRFRLKFLRRSEWWASRSSNGSIYVSLEGTGLLGWKSAVKLVLLCGGDPSPLISGWYEDWICIPAQDRDRPYEDWLRYLSLEKSTTSFPKYIETRLIQFDAGVWEDPLLH